MKIYVSHSSAFDYKTELYDPLKAIAAEQCELYLPHQTQITAHNTRKVIASSDLFFAEVSYPSTGQGIEIAWADAADIPIVCFHEQSAKISSSLKLICCAFYAYKNRQNMASLFAQVVRDLLIKIKYL